MLMPNMIMTWFHINAKLAIFGTCPQGTGKLPIGSVMIALIAVAITKHCIIRKKTLREDQVF